ncbi:MAG: nitrogenase [Syntrophobacteraceae bacterium]|jgi:nitrogenase molybdenum-iron protein NifN|nr:nitrogenase [Syntrophobacteraceae bacterium]
METSPTTTTKTKTKASPYISTTNACKLCKPMGACLAFRGIEGAVPFLHGSQGCATYMRRYIISHFREPMDIASSALGEKHAVYGGEANLKQGLVNVMKKYGPGLVGIATTCLTETIGDDVPMILKAFRREWAAREGNPELPVLVNVSTPSYAGTHMEGFHAAVRALADQLARGDEKHDGINLMPGMVSPEDLRYLKEVTADFGLRAILLPDYSETLDGPALEDYEKIPRGGTPVTDVVSMGGSRATIEFGRALGEGHSAGSLLEARFGVPVHRVGMPIGLRETDRFFEVLEEASGICMPRKHALERGRLLDAFVDGHKVVFGRRAVVYGEEDLVVGLTSFLCEIGVKPVLCASGGTGNGFREAIEAVTRDILLDPPEIREGVDFYEIAEEAREMAPELLVGHSKGYHLARRWNVPLIRVGFPIHDRFGGHRTLHLGYRGAMALLDRLVNELLERKQEDSPVGYTYL